MKLVEIKRTKCVYSHIQTVVTECVIWVWTHHYRSRDIYTSNFISCAFCAGIHFDVCAYDGTAEEEGICTVPRLLILKGEKYKDIFLCSLLSCVPTSHRKSIYGNNDKRNNWHSIKAPILGHSYVLNSV